MNAPFPYYGGKRRIAAQVWQEFGDVDVYVEPFAGSLAVLLGAPRVHDREVVSDTDGNIANFWRSIRDAPDEVAYWADYPTYHHDLTARHRWLRETADERAEMLRSDPSAHDAKAAGWWVWGISNWIGGGWCRLDTDHRPHVAPCSGGQGVSVQRKTGAVDRIPHVAATGGGQGISVQRKAEVLDWIPHVAAIGGGRGVSVQRKAVSVDVGSGDRLLDWFRALAQRLERVIVLDRGWEACVTDTVLQQTPKAPKPPVAVFLDPPYRTSTGRTEPLYQSDLDGSSEDVAVAAYRWAVKHGERYRIAYCFRDGDFDVPDGWKAVSRSFMGRDKPIDRDVVMYSPACTGLGTGAAQLKMFD